MSKPITIIALILLTSFSLFAQIEDEIISYVDSTELILDNGRKLLAKSVAEGDYDKVEEIYYFLEQKAESRDCSAFSFLESLFISCLTSEWDLWVDLASNSQDYNELFCYYNVFPIYPVLYSEVSQIAGTLLLVDEGLTPEDKQILELYLLILQSGYDEDLYSTNLKVFREAYPNSKYNSFINSYLHEPKVKGSFGFSFGAAYLFPTGNLGELFAPNAAFYMGLDVKVNRGYFSLFFCGGSLKLTEPAKAKVNNYDTTFPTNTSFPYVDGGILAGYLLLRNQRFHIAPYIFIGGGSLKSDVYEVADDMEDKETKVYHSFMFGPGLHSEIKLIGFPTKNRYNEYSIKNHLSLKIDFGYNIITSHNWDNSSGNIFYVRSALVWGIGSF